MKEIKVYCPSKYHYKSKSPKLNKKFYMSLFYVLSGVIAGGFTFFLTH